MWNFPLYKDFRREQNEIAREGFKGKGYAVQDNYPFILRSRDDWRKNIILGRVADYIEKTKNDCGQNSKSFPIHKYFHHGLSSQAMLFNLLGDVVINNDLKLVSGIFNYPSVKIDEKSELSFEYSDRETFNEKQQQPTSFDFVIKNKDSKSIFVEAKYVETEFGKCSTIEKGECEGLNPVNNPDLCYLTHKGRTYWELMNKHGLSQAFAQSPICPFAVYYQFYRELLFAIENNGYYVILIDRRNPAFYKSGANSIRGLLPVLTNLIPETLKNLIKIVYIQDVVDKLEEFGYDWINEFREKYGMKK